MINWETIKSLYNDKPTLLQWLKKVEAALAASVLQVVDVEKVSTSEIKLNFIFEDGTKIETPTIALPYEIQSVAIINGHLILTLENGETLDAGNLGAVSGFSIDAAQHLIVTYQDGTSQDLGAIFQGNVNVAGNFTANSIIENMNGYNGSLISEPNYDYDKVYLGVVKNGNKLTFVVSVKLTKRTGASSPAGIATFSIPSAVADKLTPTNVGGINFLDNREITAFSAFNSFVKLPGYISKPTSNTINFVLATANMVEDTQYLIRYEATFLLSDSL